MSDLARLNAALAPNYRIERELAGGGMSRVFLATEQALGRPVVVKVLPHDMAAQVSLERFKREVALAATLQHPHIVPLLSAGEADGQPFFTMPFIDGESLRARLARQGELPVHEAVRLLREIAAALAYAHGRGVVHRDIKPDNVLLSDGSAMVTDFGVAKALSSSGAVPGGTLTTAGVALGTPAYMSPEQATGDPALDHRSDIYSFGVLAYELLTGYPPFGGRTPQGVLAAHVTETPESITIRRPGLPPALTTIVMRCLAKRPADRPQSVTEIVQALDAVTTPGGGMRPADAAPATRAAGAIRKPAVRWIAGGVLAIALLAAAWYSRGFLSIAGAGAPVSLAVIAFDNKSGDSTYDYLAEGLGDEVRSALTGVPELVVKARASSVRFRSRDADVRDASARLAANALLMGSVNRSGSRMRVTAELVRAPSGDAVWSGTFDRPAGDVVSVQDSIVRAVTGALRVAQAGARTDGGGGHGTADPEAYDLYLRGKHSSLPGTDIAHGIELFKAAVARDPGFAAAQAALAAAYSFLPFEGIGSADSAIALARPVLERARALDSTLTDVVLAQGGILIHDYRFAEAQRHVEQALAARKNDAMLRTMLSNILSNQGRVDDAIEEVRRARQLDPLNVSALMSEQYFVYLRRDFRGAIELTPRVLDLDPGNLPALQALLLAYVFTGRPDSAVAVAERILRLDPRAYGGRIFPMVAYAAAGRWDAYDEQKALRARDPADNSPNFERAIAHVVEGRFDDATADLARSVSSHEAMTITSSIHCDPLFDPLKGMQRYAAIIAQLGGRACKPLGRWPFPRPPAGHAVRRTAALPTRLNAIRSDQAEQHHSPEVPS